MVTTADISEGDISSEGGLVCDAFILVGGEVEGESGGAVHEDGGGDIDEDVDDDAVAWKGTRGGEGGGGGGEKEEEVRGE